MVLRFCDFQPKINKFFKINIWYLNITYFSFNFSNNFLQMIYCACKKRHWDRKKQEYYKYWKRGIRIKHIVQLFFFCSFCEELSLNMYKRLFSCNIISYVRSNCWCVYLHDLLLAKKWGKYSDIWRDI